MNAENDLHVLVRHPDHYRALAALRDSLRAKEKREATDRRVPFRMGSDHSRDTARAMSQENVELYRRGIDAFNRRDLDAFLSTSDPDVEFFSRFLNLEGGGPYRGHEGLRSWWEELLVVSPDFRADIEEIRELGDDVVIARVRFHGHGAESNVPMDQTSWQIVRARDTKAIWTGIYRSEAEALEAAGLSE